MKRAVYIILGFSAAIFIGAVSYSGVQNMVIAATAADLSTGWPDKTLVWQEDTSALKILDGGAFSTINGGGGVSDGDKGDISVSGGGATWTVDTGLAATKIGGGGVSTTEFDYLGSVTSDIQTQINAKGDASGPGSSTDNAIARFDGTTGKLIQNSSPTIGDDGELILEVGDTDDAPVKFQEGTNLTTAEDGALEMDANVIYGTTDAGNRGYIPVKHFIRVNASRTLPNDSNENAIFNDPTNGRLTLETGTYIFEALLGITAMSSSTGNAQIDILGAGTATCNDWAYSAIGKDGTLISVNAVLGVFPVIQNTPVSMFTGGAGTEMWINARGTFTVTVAGTLIPSIDQATGAAASVALGSYFMCERIGSDSVVSVGQWD